MECGENFFITLRRTPDYVLIGGLLLHLLVGKVLVKTAMEQVSITFVYYRISP